MNVSAICDECISDLVLGVSGDFGGCFGLFLGGSVLSIFEFFDLVIYNLIVKWETTKRMKTRRIAVRPELEFLP